MRAIAHRLRASRLHGRVGGWPGAVFLALAVVLSGHVVAHRVSASPGLALRIVDAAGNTPVVNEGGRVALRVVDGSGNQVTVSSWSSDNRAVGKVKRTNGLLRGKAFGFATVTAQTSQGPVSGFVVCARVRRQNGAMTQGDTKTDTGGNVYLSSPTRHVLYKATAVSADVFAGQSGVSGYQEGTGGGVRFNGPAGIGVDNRAEGGLYVADTANHCIRKVDFRGRSSLAAGTPGFEGTMFGDDNPMSEAVLNGPRGVASVGANLYVTDTGNHCVWYVDVQRQRVQLVAGEPGEAGNANGEGRAARFDSPSGIAVNTRGNLLAVADTGNNVVRLIAIAPRSDGEGVIGQVTTLGLGSSARNARILEKLDSDRGTDEIVFDQPISVSFDGVDNVYVIDNLTASVVTRPSAASGRPVERVDLAQVGTLGDPASVTVRRTQAFVLDEAATTDATAVNVVEVGAPMIRSVTPDTSRLEGGQQVTITGTNFAPESMLTLGDAEVTAFNVDSSTRITFTVPPQQAPGGRTLSIATRGGVAQSVFAINSSQFSALSNGEITTVAGGVPYIGDGGEASIANVAAPGGVALDAAGNLYIADTANNRIRRISASTGQITTVAGTGVRGYDGDNKPATSARLLVPYGVAVDGSGNFFIADTFNHRIRRVDASTGEITTVAGTGEPGYDGDGKPATSARLNVPYGLAVDGAGNLFIADSSNSRIRRVDTATGVIETVAGTGAAGYDGDDKLAVAAQLDTPTGVAVDTSGSFWIADRDNYRIRHVDGQSGRIATVAGTGSQGYDGDDKPATAAKLFYPWGVASDTDGSLLIADAASHRVRRVDAFTGRITSVAGTGTGGYDGDDKPAVTALLDFPYGAVVDGAGNLFIAEGYGSRIRRVDGLSGRIATAAGTGEQGYDGDDKPATLARLNVPWSVEVDVTGNIFIADTGNHRIRRVDAATGQITTVAGTGTAGYNGDGRPAVSAQLNLPVSIAIDASANLYIADANNNRIRRVDESTAQISTVAGTGVNGYDGDERPAISARLSIPEGVAVDASGNLFIADTFGNRIRRVDGSTGQISTIAGTGVEGFDGDDRPAASARLALPRDVAVDESGNLFIADTGNARVRRVDASTGRITTVAGSGGVGYDGDNGPAGFALLDSPDSVAVDGAGNVFIADRRNNRIRRTDAVSGRITTVVGTGVKGYNGDNGPAVGSQINWPISLAIDDQGNLFFADHGNSAVRVVKSIAVPKR